MQERGPWWRVVVAVSVLAAIIALAYGAFQLGGFAVTFHVVRQYFENQGIAPDDAGNVAAGTLQALVDIIFLVGVLAVFGFVERGFKKQARQRQAARAVLNAYKAFVIALGAVRIVQERQEIIPYNQFFAARIARLRRTMDDLSTRPFFFADVLPESASDAIDDARDGLAYFYAFTDNLTAWAASDSADPKKEFFTGFVRSRTQQKAMDFVASFHNQMEQFFRNAHPARNIRQEVEGALATRMAALGGVAHRLVYVGRPKDPAQESDEQ